MDNTINQWLQTYEPFNEFAIHSEELTEEVGNLALQRTGWEALPLKYITDKGWRRQYQYLLLLKKESEIDEQRYDNFDLLDDFSNWFEDKNKTKSFPILGNNMEVENVSCSNSLVMLKNEDGSISDYGLQIYFNIRKEI